MLRVNIAPGRREHISRASLSDEVQFSSAAVLQSSVLAQARSWAAHSAHVLATHRVSVDWRARWQGVRTPRFYIIPSKLPRFSILGIVHTLTRVF